MKIKKNFSIAPESNYEIRRLAKLWDISIGQAWSRCCHYVAELRVGQNADIESRWQRMWFKVFPPRVWIGCMEGRK